MSKHDKIVELKQEFPTLEKALEEIDRFRQPIKGNNFWVKTAKTEGGSEVILFRNKDEAVMSFKTMEEAITQDVSIGEFKFNPDPSKGEADWTITPISWRDIAKARLEIQKKQEEKK